MQGHDTFILVFLPKKRSISDISFGLTISVFVPLQNGENVALWNEMMGVGVHGCVCVCVWERLAGTVVCPHTQFHHLVCVSHENANMAMILFVEDLKVKCSLSPSLCFWSRPVFDSLS